MGDIVFIGFFVDEEVVFEGLDGEVVELKVGVALFGVGAGVEEDESIEVEFEPFGCVGVLVVFDDVDSQFGGGDACVLEPGEVHLLVLEFWELFVESQNGSEVLLHGGVFCDVYTCSVGKAGAGRALEVEHIRYLVPVVGIVPEVGAVASEGELSFRVEPTVQRGTPGTRRKHNHQRVFAGVALGWGVDVEEGFLGSHLQVASIEGVDFEGEGK